MLLVLRYADGVGECKCAISIDGTQKAQWVGAND
jgi:hypothetical protein